MGEAYLGVADEHDLRAGTLLVVRCHGLDDGGGALRGGAVVAGAATG